MLGKYRLFNYRGKGAMFETSTARWLRSIVRAANSSIIRFLVLQGEEVAVDFECDRLEKSTVGSKVRT